MQTDVKTENSVADQKTISEPVIDDGVVKSFPTEATAYENSYDVAEGQNPDNTAISTTRQPQISDQNLELPPIAPETEANDFLTLLEDTMGPLSFELGFADDPTESYTFGTVNTENPNITERPFGGNPLYAYPCHSPQPTLVCCGACHHMHVHHITQSYITHGHRQDAGNYYWMAPAHNRGFHHGCLGEAPYARAQYSPAPAPSDCTTASDVSNELSVSSFGSTLQDNAQSTDYDRHQEWYPKNTENDHASEAWVQESSRPTIAPPIEQTLPFTGGDSIRTYDDQNGALNQHWTLENPTGEAGWPGQSLAYNMLSEFDELPYPGSDGEYPLFPTDSTSPLIKSGIDNEEELGVNEGEGVDEGQKRRKDVDKRRMAGPGRGRKKSAAHREHTRGRQIHKRTATQDTFLIQSRLAGMSYREIQEKGGFTEAEATLRGRFRNLTKSKDKRVRQPQWTETDVKLLRDAVSRFGKQQDVRVRKYKRGSGTERRILKVSWCAVAEYISQHGGSYEFGVGTCRKKWDEINGRGYDAPDFQR